MIKRIFACICAAALLFSTVACEDKNENTSHTHRSGSSSTKDEQPEDTNDDTSKTHRSGSSSTKDVQLEEQYYRCDEDEYKGEFYWLYQFDGGYYTAKAYTPYGDVIANDEYGVYEVMEEGEYTIKGDKIIMDPDGAINFRSENYVTFPSDYTYTLYMDEGIMTDDKDNVYFPGKPWNENEEYSSPIVLADTYAQQGDGWYVWVDEASGAVAETYRGGEEYDYDLYIDVDDPGPDPWSVQAQYTDLKLESGSKYHITFQYYIQTANVFTSGYDHTKHKSSFGLQHNGGDYETYLEEPLTLTQVDDDYTTIDVTFIMTDSTDDDAMLFINAGGLGDTFARVSIKNLVIEKLS